MPAKWAAAGDCRVNLAEAPDWSRSSFRPDRRKTVHGAGSAGTNQAVGFREASGTWNMAVRPGIRIRQVGAAMTTFIVLMLDVWDPR